MCWALKTSYTTASIMEVAHKIARDELNAGDALWQRSGDKGHIALFVNWATGPQHTPSTSTTTPTSRVLTSPCRPVGGSTISRSTKTSSAHTMADSLR